MDEIQLSSDLNVITAEINSYKQVAGQAIFEIGRRLKHVKENDLVHGEWIEWLDSVQIHERQAQRLIKVIEELPNTTTLSHLGETALYLIATMPEEEREKEHTLSNGKTKTVDEMTVRELQEVKRKLRESEQREKAERQERERLELENEELANKEPEVIEKVIEDETKINKLQKEIEKMSKEKEDLEHRMSLEKKDAETYRELKRDIDNLRTRKDDIVRQIDNASSIGKFIARVERSFEEDLAPIKYSRAIEELERSEAVQESLEKIVSKVEGWCREIRGLMRDNNIVEVIEHE